MGNSCSGKSTAQADAPAPTQTKAGNPGNKPGAKGPGAKDLPPPPPAMAAATALDKATLQKLFSPDFIMGRVTPHITEHYDIKETLGEGQFGVVRKAVNKETGEVCACKTVTKRQVRYLEELEDIRREVNVMKHLADCPTAVRFREVYEDKHAVHIVMEYCSGGELFDRIVKKHNYSERAAAEIMRQMLETVAYMHELGVLHRDLKPENFLFATPDDDSAMKLTDFGLSLFFKPSDVFHDTLGSELYAAPEVWPKVVRGATGGWQYQRPSYTEKVDMWSCGVILYILLCGSPPFQRADVDKKLNLAGPIWNHISKDAKDVVMRLLDRDPKTRPTAREALKHPWLTAGEHVSDAPLDSAVAVRIQNFSNMNKLKQKALQIIATTMDDSEIEGLRNMFEAIDTDGSGTITLEELKNAMKQFNMTMRDVEELMAAADVDGSGQIEWGEFLAATINKSQLEREENIYRAFRAIDKDGNGVLSHQEITEALSDFGLSDSEITSVIQEVDADGNGEIDYDEFLTMMRGANVGAGALSRAATGSYGEPTKLQMRRKGAIGVNDTGDKGSGGGNAHARAERGAVANGHAVAAA